MKMSGGEMKFWGILSAIIAAVLVFAFIHFYSN